MGQVNIRRLHAKDAQCAIKLYSALNPDVEIGNATHFADLVARNEVMVIGAEQDNQIVAMATLHLLPNMTYGGRSFGVVENVITLPKYQRQGIMRMVMEHLHQIAWNAKAYKIMLMTGTDTGAKDFYEKLGYSADQKHGLQIRQVPPRKGTVGGAS